ncbi:MAG: hypothetical protein Athens071416_36 [Parcubacteria group bacterium Athens0714_16]|nr:MAG: hypothetical protein Athens071416_36 [Parcubacteria group bacterium Athens0714_16]
MNYFVIIEILGSIFYFIQKVFLSSGKRLGWLFGFLGSIAFTLVTLHKGSFAYSILEITSGIIFVFGFFLWQKFEKVEKRLTFLMGGITIIGIVVIFLFNLGSPNWVLEDSMVVLFVIGAVFLVLRNPIGWLLYIAGHIILIAYAYILGTYSILILQIISIPFAIIGYRNLKNHELK